MTLYKLLLKLRSHVTISSEANIALYELTTTLVRANLPSRRVRDDSLPLASYEAAPTSSSLNAKMSGVALKRTKAKARLSSDSLKPKGHLALALLQRAAKLT